MQSLKKFSFFLTNFCIIISYSELSWLYSYQSDSLLQQSEANTDSIIEYKVKFYDNLDNQHLYNLFLNDFSDSMLFSLELDLLRAKQNPLSFSQITLSDQWKINEQLTNYFQFQRGVRLKSELGIFGKVLTQSKNLTAIILAIIHLIKYRKGFY